MPVSVITDVVTWIEMGLQLGVVGVIVYLLRSFISGGIISLIRSLSFAADNLIIKYIDKFYSYYDKLLNGTIFSPTVVDTVMKRIYVFVAVIVLFKLIMLLMKYIINPEMVSDEKLGAASLIKRVIIGMCLMLFLPTIFNLAIDIQSAILSDNVIGQIFLSKAQIRTYEKNKNQMGRLLAFNVYQGFWSIDENQVSQSLKDSYSSAVAALDPKLVGDINQKIGDDYAIDYFPILSIVVLGYVLYLIIKYCIDIVVRMFKLFVLQLLGPLAISDYMVNGDSKEMFKSWVKTTVSVYLLLFIRVLSLWFVAFVTLLMNQQCTNVKDGVCTDSLLYITDTSGPDYLLRAIITLGLLAFLMDFPKLLSSILGFDLEQDASVKGMLGKVGGIGKMLGMGAVMAGGSALGGAFARTKASAQGKKEMNGLKKDLHSGKITREQFNERAAQVKANTKSAKHAATMGGLKGIGKAALSTVPGGQALSQSFAAASGEVDKERSKQKQTALEGEEAKFRASQTATTEASYKQQAVANEQINQIKDLLINRNVDTTTNVHVNNNANKQTQGTSTEIPRGTAPRTYEDGTPVPDASVVGDYGRNTTSRASRARGEETGMQQRVNDAAHVHDAPTAEESRYNAEHSAFATMSDEDFKRQYGGDQTNLAPVEKNQ